MKYQIDEFEVDTRLFQLLKNNQPVSIEPKVFDLIVYLVDNRTRVVSRDELFEKLWQGREVSDTSLSNHIKIARKAFDDDGERQKVINTIRGRGYQFVASVKLLELSNEQVNTDDDESIDSGSRRNADTAPQVHDSITILTENKVNNGAISPSKSLSNRAGRAKRLNAKSATFLAIIGLMIAISIFWQIPGSDHHGIPQNEIQNYDTRPYILVVPFEVYGNNKNKWQPFADQITREIILKLRKISGLRIVPAASAFTFKQNKTHQYIKERIPQAQYVLSGSIDAEAEPKFRISGELSSLHDESLLWNDSFLSQIDGANVFRVQSNIATAVSSSLKVVVLEPEAKKIGEHHTFNLEAYELYVAGQQQLNLLTHESLYKSIELFNSAIELDSNFEEAIVSKANAYRIIMSYFEKPVNVLPKVVESVLQVLEVNPESADAYSSLGLAYVFAWRWKDAWQMLSAAQQADPNLALTQLGFALYYTGLGEPKKVKQALVRANQLDPLNIELADWGHWAFVMSGQTDDAVSWAENKIKLHPDVGIIYSGASVSASLTGQHQRAIKLAQKGLELDTGGTYPLLALAQAYGYANQKDKILPLLDKVGRDNRYVCPYETAVTYLLLDDRNKAFELLNNAVKYRSNCLVFTKNDPRLEPLRHSSDFNALLTRVGLDDASLKRYKR